jgi:hypothetical protein
MISNCLFGRLDLEDGSRLLLLDLPSRARRSCLRLRSSSVSGRRFSTIEVSELRLGRLVAPSDPDFSSAKTSDGRLGGPPVIPRLGGMRLALSLPASAEPEGRFLTLPGGPGAGLEPSVPLLLLFGPRVEGGPNTEGVLSMVIPLTPFLGELSRVRLSCIGC